MMNTPSITSSQIRSARAALGWSLEDLSRHSGVSVSTIRRSETIKGLARLNQPNLNAIRTAVEKAGIEFIGTPDEGPGIRLWQEDRPAAKDAGTGSA